MTMRMRVILMTLMCLGIFGFAIANVQNKLTSVAGSSLEIVYQFEQLPTADLKKDCTVKLDFTLDNGTQIKGEITFADISWWDCTKIQVAAWFERNF